MVGHVKDAHGHHRRAISDRSGELTAMLADPMNPPWPGRPRGLARLGGPRRHRTALVGGLATPQPRFAATSAATASGLVRPRTRRRGQPLQAIVERRGAVARRRAPHADLRASGDDHPRRDCPLAPTGRARGSTACRPPTGRSSGPQDQRRASSRLAHLAGARHPERPHVGSGGQTPDRPRRQPRESGQPERPRPPRGGSGDPAARQDAVSKGVQRRA